MMKRMEWCSKILDRELKAVKNDENITIHMGTTGLRILEPFGQRLTNEFSNQVLVNDLNFLQQQWFRFQKTKSCIECFANLRLQAQKPRPKQYGVESKSHKPVRYVRVKAFVIPFC